MIHRAVFVQFDRIRAMDSSESEKGGDAFDDSVGQNRY